MKDMKENMTLLLYDYHELEERASSNLRVWKAWHTTLYIFAAIFGILNYTFLQNSSELIDGHCILNPNILVFKWVELTDITDAKFNGSFVDTSLITTTDTAIVNKDVLNATDNVQNSSIPKSDEEKAKTVKREVSTFNETTTVDKNATLIIENSTGRLFLDTTRSFFALDKNCEFSEYMPLLSTVFAVLWATLFIICPGGGRATAASSLKQPWRILMPALLFALVLVGLTGHSFTTTNSGLQAFCAAFSKHGVTNSTTCSSVNRFILNGWNASWGLGGRVAATRAASAGAWVSWACAAALLLARCLAAPDFTVRRTCAHLKDPCQKITPHLIKSSPRRSQRSAHSSPSIRGTVSVRSEPTNMTELVTASMDHGQDSVPTSITTTPVRREPKGGEIEMSQQPRGREIEMSQQPRNEEIEMSQQPREEDIQMPQQPRGREIEMSQQPRGEEIEMAYSPQELNGQR